MAYLTELSPRAMIVGPQTGSSNSINRCRGNSNRLKRYLQNAGIQVIPERVIVSLDIYIKETRFNGLTATAINGFPNGVQHSSGVSKDVVWVVVKRGEVFPNSTGSHRRVMSDARVVRRRWIGEVRAGSRNPGKVCLSKGTTLVQPNFVDK